MIPAQQRLETRDGAVLQPDDRLEEDLHLVALESAAQIGLQRQAVVAVVAHGRTEDLDAVAAVPLGVRHRDLGVLQHLLALRIRLRIVEGNADGGRQRRSRDPHR